MQPKYYVFSMMSWRKSILWRNSILKRLITSLMTLFTVPYTLKKALWSTHIALWSTHSHMENNLGKFNLTEKKNLSILPAKCIIWPLLVIPHIITEILCQAKSSLFLQHTISVEVSFKDSLTNKVQWEGKRGGNITNQNQILHWCMVHYYNKCTENAILSLIFQAIILQNILCTTKTRSCHTVFWK